VLRLERCLKHRGEIFIGHGALLLIHLPYA
jgi:hypothetical protein